MKRLFLRGDGGSWTRVLQHTGIASTSVVYSFKFKFLDEEQTPFLKPISLNFAVGPGTRTAGYPSVFAPLISQRAKDIKDVLLTQLKQNFRLQLKLFRRFYDTTAQSARHYIDIIAVESSSSPFWKNTTSTKSIYLLNWILSTQLRGIKIIYGREIITFLVKP